ncbi:MAG: ImmA/IrrE family metallo-endopeptidase [Clostridia bacterium]|nr:ImmA/IrrE family metallo-endopeptidase [Clostridia bacterium]
MKQERKDKNEKIQELTEKLQTGIQELYDSEKYRDYLRTMAKFHHYSFNNSLLIWAQRPDATAVAGYRAWQTKFERTVNPGAKGIMIYEPSNFKRTLREVVTDEDGNPVLDQDGNKITRAVERTFPSFKVGYVFAYEDTSGKPLPSIVSIVDKDVDNFDAVIDALQKVSPAPIRFDAVSGGANGYYDLLKREIVVKDTLPQAQKIKTAVHEVAHSILHDKIDGLDKEASKQEMECTVESVAYTFCSYFGLDTSEYSFGYVAGWSVGKELKELQTKMEIIRSTAHTIISGVEAEIMKDTIKETESEEMKPMIPEMTVTVVQTERPRRTMSHRRR